MLPQQAAIMTSQALNFALNLLRRLIGKISRCLAVGGGRCQGWALLEVGAADGGLFASSLVGYQGG